MEREYYKLINRNALRTYGGVSSQPNVAGEFFEYLLANVEGTIHGALPTRASVNRCRVILKHA